VVALVVIVFLLALGACVWLFVASCRLMMRSFSRMFAPSPGATFGPPTTPRVDGPSLPSELPVLAAHPVPGWTVKMIETHLRGCPACRTAIAEYIADANPTPGAPVPALATILNSLEPETITRIVHLVEAEDAAAIHEAQP
jgi:hypothetical protein